MKWLTDYAAGRKRQPKRPKAPKVLKPVTERVRIVDPGVDEADNPVTVYWEGSMPLDELLAFDPQARCRTTRIPARKRLIVWWLTPAFAVLLAFAAIYLNASDPLLILPAAFAGAVFLGLPVGLGSAWVIVRRWLQVEAWWNLMRIPVADAKRNHLKPRDPEDLFVLTGVVPRPIMADVEDDSVELEQEIQTLLWRNEQLRLGEAGWATSNFLRGMGAARSREELLKAGVVRGPRPTLEKPGPDQRGMPQ